jgi:hypothetical protein
VTLAVGLACLAWLLRVVGGALRSVAGGGRGLVGAVVVQRHPIPVAADRASRADLGAFSFVTVESGRRFFCQRRK